MEQMIVVLALVTAAAAAARSTWSPCGQSMLSTITPLGERSRGARYTTTAAWFVVGGVLGGATLGIGAAALALGVHALGLSVVVRAAAVAAVAALVAAVSDGGWLGFRLPGHHRQVNERWLDRYRAWLYGAGFGWQIGCGLATYIMTAGVYLMVLLAGLGARPATAFGICALFGAVRGLAVLASSRVVTPADLYALHARFDALGPSSRAAMIAVEVGVAATLAAGLITARIVGAALLGAALLGAAAFLHGRRVYHSRERVPIGGSR